MSQGLRNFLAVTLSLGVLILWYTVIAPPAPPPKAKPQQIPAPVVETTQKSPQEKPVFVGGKEIFLENDLIRVGINTQGGVLTDWELKKYKKERKVSLVDPEAGTLNTSVLVEGVKIPNPVPFKIERQTGSEIHLSWSSSGIALEKKITLPKNSYRLDVEWEIYNPTEKTITTTSALELGKRATEESKQRGILFFKSPPDRWHPVSYQNGSFQEVLWEKTPVLEKKEGAVGWIGAQSRYFLIGLLPLGTEAKQLEIGKEDLVGGDPLFFQRTSFNAQVLPKEKWVQKLQVFGGPKELKLLKEIGHGFEKAIGYGWTSIIAIPILYLLQLFYKIVHNYGISIILLTVLIKMLLNPINRKSLESMKGMQVLQPKLKEIQAKFKNDKEKLNMETMRLFKAHKVNPMSGCLPMLLQLPIYIALYRVLWSSVELYQAPFFWFYNDLSAPDPYLITPVLLGITMFIQTKMTPSVTADPVQQKMMMLMPLMFCAFMVFLPMGLGLYIFVNTGMTILQQWMYKKGMKTRDLLLGWR